MSTGLVAVGMPKSGSCEQVETGFMPDCCCLPGSRSTMELTTGRCKGGSELTGTSRLMGVCLSGMVVIISPVLGRREEEQVVYVSKGWAKPGTDMLPAKPARTSPTLDSTPSLEGGPCISGRREGELHAEDEWDWRGVVPLPELPPTTTEEPFAIVSGMPEADGELLTDCKLSVIDVSSSVGK